MADLMSSWTPYNYSFNNPIRFNDPLGDRPSATFNVGNTNDNIGQDQSKDWFGKQSAMYSNGGGGGIHRYLPSSPPKAKEGEKQEEKDKKANDNGESSTTSEYYNSEVVTGLNAANIVRGNFEFGGAVAYQELTKGGNVVKITDRAYYTGLVKYGKVIGRTGYGLTAGVVIYELSTGNDNTHTWVDVSVSVLGVGAIAVFGTVAAPAVAVGAIGYGIWSTAVGSHWIDSNWGYRPVNKNSK